MDESLAFSASINGGFANSFQRPPFGVRVLQEGGPLLGRESGLLSNTRK